jgi:catechol 2,3-dioxygenase-like lactoylglutathione lyase family enzyme
VSPPPATSSPLCGLTRGVDHVTLPVLDLDVAEQFYVAVLGAELLERFDAEQFLRYRPDRRAELDDPRNSPLHLSVRFGGTTRLDLFLQTYGQAAITQAHPHIAFGVTGADLDIVLRHLAASGVPVDGPRRLGPPGQASLYFFDPFGNKLEFVAMDYRRDIPIGAPDWTTLARAARPELRR